MRKRLVLSRRLVLAQMRIQMAVEIAFECLGRRQAEFKLGLLNRTVVLFP